VTEIAGIVDRIVTALLGYTKVGGTAILVQLPVYQIKHNL